MSTIRVLLPELSPSMTEGNIVRWLKPAGAVVKKGDSLVEIETDKAVAEVEAEHDGLLSEILIPDGTQSVPINAVIALLERESAPAPASMPTVVHAPSATGAEMPAALPKSGPEDICSDPRDLPRPAQVEAARVRASPAARRLAHEAGIELKGVVGSGPGGRVVRVDIQALSAAGPSRLPPEYQSGNPRVLIDKLGIPYHAEPVSNMRRVIARRLTESKQSIPHCYVSIDCRVDKLVSLRADLNAAGDPPRLSINDFVILATARALNRVPAVNATWTDEAILRYTRVDLAVAVSSSSGLLTPVVVDAAKLTLFEVSTRMRALMERARAGKLRPEQYQGGTFSLTNLGTHGIQNFNAIINPPHAGILAVGAAKSCPVVSDGMIGVGTVMSCTLSFDHRVVDGVQAAEFLRAVQAQLEAPACLLR